MKRLSIVMICLFTGLAVGSVSAQSDQQVKKVRKYLRAGNKEFRKGNRDEASTYYRKAYSLDSINTCILYNLATSLLPEEYWRPWPKTDDSTMVKEVNYVDSLYRTAAEREPQTVRKSRSFYNVGVMYQSLYQSKGNYQHLLQAIDAYKDALRNNPRNEDARYNLVVCQRQLKKDKKQDQPQQQNQQQNQQQQEQNDSTQQNQQQNDSTQQQQQKPQQPPQQKEQEQQQQNQQQQNQQQQNQQQQNQQQQDQQQNQQQNMDRQNAEQLLKNAMQKERETQKRMNEAQQGMGSRRLNKKNW